MKKQLSEHLIATSNGKFYGFYTYFDLPTNIQKELVEDLNPDNDDDNETYEQIATDNYVSSCGTFYSLSDYLTTDGIWLNLPEYHNNGIHGVLSNDYSVGIELSDCGDSYRTWFIS